MELTPSQSKIAKDTHRFRVLNCGRRFGKTTLSVEEIKGRALFSGAKIAYIAPTHQQARDIAWEMLKRELQPIILKTNESRLELEVKTKDWSEGDTVNTSSIVLKSWEAVESMRGQSFDFLIIDEVATMRNFWTGWNEVLSPTLIDRRGHAMFISTPKGFNHFYDLYNMQEKDKDYTSFHFTTYDNPLIPVDEIEREKLSKPENTFAQEYLASFRKSEGLVYKEFRRDIHVYNLDENGEPIKAKNVIKTIAGVDFGFTNPAVCLTIEKDFDGSYWVTNEWYKRGKTDDDIALYVRGYHYNEVYPDPESPSAIKKMQDLGINVMEVVKNKDSIKHGIDKIRALFQQRKLYIHHSCQNLIDELETYSYPEKKENRNEEENPVKENDHALDALRYAIYMDDPQEVRGYLRNHERTNRVRANKKGFE